MHRSDVDYSTLARAEAAAHQQEDAASSQLGGDAAPGTLQRSRPLPSSSDAGHLALAAEQAGGGDADGSSQGDWSVPSTQENSRGSAFEDAVGSSGIFRDCWDGSTAAELAPVPVCRPVHWQIVPERRNETYAAIAEWQGVQNRKSPCMLAQKQPVHLYCVLAPWQILICPTQHTAGHPTLAGFCRQRYDRR